MHQHIIFHTIHAIKFKKIHMDIFGPTHKPRLFLTVPKNSAWAARNCPKLKTAQNSAWRTENSRPFRPLKLQPQFITHIQGTQGPFSVRDQSGTVQNGSQNFQHVVPIFGTDQTVTHGLIQSKPFTRLLNRK